MKNTRTIPYKENRIHGSKNFPCSYYWADYREFLPDEIFNAKHHWHDEVEFLYFQEGVYELEINMQKYTIEEEAFSFIGSGDLHSILSNRGFIEKAIVFSPSMLCFENKDAVQTRFIDPLLSNELSMPHVITRSNPCFESMKKAFLNIVSCFVDSAVPGPPKSHQDNYIGLSYASPGNQLCIKASLLYMLALLDKEQLLASRSSLQDPRVDLIKKTISYMKENYKETIYIRDLAQLANMNDQYFCRFFKQLIGHPPIEFLNELRIRQAMELLVTTNLSVMDISLECGFNNLGNFMRTFKKHVQTTPLQYRKSARSKV